MTPTDPMIPLWAILLALVTFALGFLAGILTRPSRRKPSTDWKRPKDEPFTF